MVAVVVLELSEGKEPADATVRTESGTNREPQPTSKRNVFAVSLLELSEGKESRANRERNEAGKTLYYNL